MIFYVNPQSFTDVTGRFLKRHFLFLSGFRMKLTEFYILHLKTKLSFGIVCVYIMGSQKKETDDEELRIHWIHTFQPLPRCPHYPLSLHTLYFEDKLTNYLINQQSDLHRYNYWTVSAEQFEVFHLYNREDTPIVNNYNYQVTIIFISCYSVLSARPHSFCIIEKNFCMTIFRF